MDIGKERKHAPNLVVEGPRSLSSTTSDHGTRRKELIGNIINIAYCAVTYVSKSLGAEFNDSEVVSHIYPTTAAKQDVASRRWFVVHNSTSSCFSESGAKFALEVALKYKVRLGLYSPFDAIVWVAAPLPKLYASRLPAQNKKNDPPLGVYLFSSKNHGRSCRQGLSTTLG